MATFNIELTVSVDSHYRYWVHADTEEEARGIAREWAVEDASDDLDIAMRSVDEEDED